MELKRIGRYEIQRRLGKGGMGSLYLARDPGLDRLVAIKLLKEDYLEDQEFRERFAREARALARLRHPNIVVLYDFGEHEGRPFMAMEYVDGETLKQRLTRTPPLKLALGLAIVEDLCAGLANAHDAGIVHRDIKPENIMMDRQGVLKLLDFGIARHAHAESTHQMTQPGMIMGTYNYMSPEQLLGEVVDKRSDIFAVGAVLYQVIAREQAFPGAFGAVYHRVLTTGPVPLEERVPGVDPVLVQIVVRALQRNPEDRFQNVDDLRQDLVRCRKRLAERGGGAEAAHETVVLPRTPSSRSQRDSEAKRGLVNEQIRLSREAFARGDYDIALQYGERAAFVDPDNETAIELINKSRVAIDATSVLPLIEEANRLLSAGRIPDALSRAEQALAGVPDLVEADDLRNQARAVLDQIAHVREREDRISAFLERARSHFERGEYDTALRSVYEVLALDPERPQARELEQQAKARLQARRDAHARVVAARALADEGRLDDAAAELTAIAPPSDSVRSAVADAMADVERLRRRARTAAAVAKARAAVADGQFTHAISLVEAIPGDDLTADARQVRADAIESLARQRELQEQQQRLEVLLASADEFIRAGAVNQARDHLTQAAQLGLDDHRINHLVQRLDELVARVEDQRRQDALNRRAAEAVETARRLFTAGNPHAAVALLERADLAHPDIVAALADMRGELARIEERATRERQRQDDEARRAAEAEAARLREQQLIAAERQRQEHERREREQQRIAAERQRQEHEAREREQQRIIAEQQQLAETQIRQREENLQATVVRPMKAGSTQPVQAPSVPAAMWTRATPRTTALIAAAALVVLAIGWWLTSGTADQTSGPDAAQVSTNNAPTEAPAQQAATTGVEENGDRPVPAPQQTNPPTNPEEPNQPTTPQNNDSGRDARRQEEIAKARTAIQGALDERDPELAGRLLLDAQRRLGPDNFTAQGEALAQLSAARKEEDVRGSVRDLVVKSRQERDHQAAIALLNRALQLVPDDSTAQAELRRRNDALTAEARQRELEEQKRRADEQRLRQEKERADGIKNVQAAIDRALARGDLDGADTLVQDAERRYGTAPFGPQRQQLTVKREQATATAAAERVLAQIRGVLDRFAQAYNARDEAALAATWPSVPRASYRNTFNSFESLSWVFGSCEIEVNGAAATATCPVSIARVDVRGRETSETGRRRFTLRNQGGWRIEDMRVQ